MILSISGCGDLPDGEGLDLNQLFSEQVQIIDLTHALSGSSPYWPAPGGHPFRFEALASHPSGAASMARYSTPEHFGTHIDAPIHTADHQPSVDLLTPSDLFGPAAVVNALAQCDADSDYRLSREDLLAWEKEHGRLPEGAIVLMYTGWGRRWQDPEAYRNQDADAQMHFPGFSEEAGRFLVDERSIRGIGIDTLSIDPALGGFPTHRIVNGAGKFHLENVANLDQLPPSGAYLIVAPIKIEGGSGGQVRLFALVPHN